MSKNKKNEKSSSQKAKSPASKAAKPHKKKDAKPAKKKATKAAEKTSKAIAKGESSEELFVRYIEAEVREALEDAGIKVPKSDRDEIVIAIVDGLEFPVALLVESMLDALAGIDDDEFEGEEGDADGDDDDDV